MPSPFPGMDPFLEHPDEFPQLHDGFIVHLQEKLQALLPPPYFAKTGQRVWVEVSERYVEPDVSVFRPGQKNTPGGDDPSAVALLAPLRGRSPLVCPLPRVRYRDPGLLSETPSG